MARDIVSRSLQFAVSSLVADRTELNTTLLRHPEAAPFTIVYTTTLLRCRCTFSARYHFLRRSPPHSSSFFCCNLSRNCALCLMLLVIARLELCENVLRPPTPSPVPAV